MLEVRLNNIEYMACRFSLQLSLSLFFPLFLFLPSSSRSIGAGSTAEAAVQTFFSVFHVSSCPSMWSCLNI